MERKAANIYEDTRELLNQVKEDFQFKSDDHAIKFLCNMFISDNRTGLLKKYLESTKKAGE
ncbi:hypothetical protein [Paenibacillus sp. FJAT-26967]|uniref:hypothetical protein n=1 Tax=Paenibacillus sp. FJAT-26967 TaxID=1729690 RepID=UPI0008396BE6|nr:hypothetical protein [Paenibacillus sp. FJAT-26967]